MIYYIDVDDTLIRTFGSKVIPITKTIDFIKNIDTNVDSVYLWSRGGSEYCKEIAVKLGIDEKISQFLPKPDVMIDDMAITDWSFLKSVHPNSL